MRTVRTVTLLSALLVPGVGLACTCMWVGPFTRVVLGTDLVILAEVRSHDRRRLDVIVVDVLRGAERRRVLTVLGGDDANCRPPVAGFPPGTRWLFALQRTPEHAYGLSVCGEFWLEVRGDQAVGRITTAQYSEVLQSAPLADVLAWVRSGGTAPLTPRTLPSGTR